MLQPRRQNYPSNEMYQEIVRLYTLVESLQKEVQKLSGNPLARSTGVSGIERAVSIPAASDPNAAAQVYPGGINPAVTTFTLSSGITGLAVGTSPNYNLTLVAATFRSTIGAAAKASPAITAGTYAPPASITVNAEGIITAIS